MVILAHSSNPQNCIKKTNKIPEYARDFKNEYLFIRGIEKKCGEFVNRLYKIDFSDGYNEEVFMSYQAKSLMSYFRGFLKAQKLGYLKNIKDLHFKRSDVEYINDLYLLLYGIVVKLNESPIFQDFFESFIVFNFNLNLNYNDNIIESESESESESECESEYEFSDSDSD